MNICFISREYPPETHIGGIASYTYKTAGALARLGHEVHVITSAWRPGADYTERGVHVHRFQEPHVKPREAQAVAHALRVAATVRTLGTDLDIVQACEWGGEGAFYAWRSPARRPLFITRLATPLFFIEQLNEHSQFGVRGYGQRALERMQTLRSDGIISPTLALARVVSAHWKIPLDRITVVPTGMDLLEERGEDAEDAAVALPDELQGKDYLLYFGRLEERKGVHILGAALPQALGAHPELTAVFVGDDLSYRGGSMREAILAAAGECRERILFLNRLPQARLFPIVRAARLVILPSLWENLANTCLEAMRFGRPVIATTGCGFEEVIEDGRSGFLVPPGDVAALASKIVEVLGAPELAAQVGQAAQRRVGEFSIDAMARRLAEYYQTALAARATHNPGRTRDATHHLPVTAPVHPAPAAPVALESEMEHTS